MALSLGNAYGVFTETASAVVKSAPVEVTFLAALAVLWFFGHFTKLPRVGLKGVEKKGIHTPRPSTAQASPPPAARAPVRAARADRITASENVSNITPVLLTDVSWLVPQVANLCNAHVPKALETYHAALRAGLDISKAPAEDRDRLFTALATAAVRVGKVDVTLDLLRELRKHGVSISSSLFSSLTKLCVSKQLFKECICIYDTVAADASFTIDDKALWSCLLFSAVELKAYERCASFFNNLKATGAPSPKDYGNMIRCASTRGDWDLSLVLLREMRAADFEVDTIVYNTALCTCVSAEKLTEARELLDSMNSVAGVADVITYNTLIKGYAKQGKLDACFELYEQMRSQGVSPSQVTYGILLDACINENQVDRASNMFKEMSEAKCEMNTVLYTTLIKGLARVSKVSQAMEIYEQMRADSSLTPDLITFSILIKAHCDACELDVALQLFEHMTSLGLHPDEVVFNNLLGGCVKGANVSLAKRLYNDMVQRSIRPSNATFSILIRLYAECKLLDEAVDLLRTEPDAQNVDAEPRLYLQLAQSCIRERQGRRAIEVYSLMLTRSLPTAATHAALLGLCVKLNMLDTAVDILAAAAAAGGRVDAKDANLVLSAALRKRKTQCADTCSAVMARMGLAPARCM